MEPHRKCSKILCVSTKTVTKSLYTYSSKEPLKTNGVFKFQINVGKQSTEAEFTVVEGDGEPLLGKQTAIELGVLKVDVNISAVTDIKSEIETVPRAV